MAMSVTEAAVRLIVSDHVVDTDELTMHDEYRLRNIAEVRPDRIVSYHVTDDPGRVLNLVRSPRRLIRALTHGDLGPGLYMSAIPSMWSHRSRRRWDAFAKYDQRQRRRIQDAAVGELVSRGKGYVTDCEYDRFIDHLQRYVDSGDVEYLALTAGQPYNIEYGAAICSRAGTPAPDTPSVIAFELVGRFVDLTKVRGELLDPCREVLVQRGYMRRAGGAVVATDRLEELLKGWVGWRSQIALALYELGYSGAFERQGFSTTAQLAVWSRSAIVGYDVQ